MVRYSVPDLPLHNAIPNCTLNSLLVTTSISVIHPILHLTQFSIWHITLNLSIPSQFSIATFRINLNLVVSSRKKITHLNLSLRTQLRAKWIVLKLGLAFLLLGFCYVPLSRHQCCYVTFSHPLLTSAWPLQWWSPRRTWAQPPTCCWVATVVLSCCIFEPNPPLLPCCFAIPSLLTIVTPIPL